jgi:Tat protein secretion system quality control protein TatD with DNase activity
MGLVDSHCHLNFEPMGNDIAGVLERAKASNVDYMLCVSVNLEDYPEILAIAQAHNNIFASVGVHPCYQDVKEPTVEELVQLAQNENVVAETAKKALDLGFYISFSGIVTFNSAARLKEVAKQVPLDRILVETDAPYLAPAPMRGRPNQPAFVAHTAQYVADLRGIGLDEFSEQTSNNFFELFRSAVK